jgi:hypothetical protein
MDGCVELVCKPSTEDVVLAFSWPPKETGRDIFPNASILFHPKPISGESEGCS